MRFLALSAEEGGGGGGGFCTAAQVQLDARGGPVLFAINGLRMALGLMIHR